MINGLKTTPADGSVNVNRHTIYAMIPGLDTYVVSRLDKKKFVRMYTGIFVAGILASTGFVMYQMSIEPELVSEMDKVERVDKIYEKFMPQMAVIILSCMIIHFPIYTYHVRKRVKELDENVSRESKKQHARE